MGWGGERGDWTYDSVDVRFDLFGWDLAVLLQQFSGVWGELVAELVVIPGPGDCSGALWHGAVEHFCHGAVRMK